MRVLKFGGTSVENTERFLCVANILENNVQKEQIAIVLSAPAKVTNHLIMMIEKTIRGQDVSLNIREVEQIFISLLKGLQSAQPGFNRRKIQACIDKAFIQLKQTLYKIGLSRKCSDNINALIISLGERLAVTFMEELLQARGYRVSMINPIRMLLAYGHYLKSTIDIVESSRRIAACHFPSDSIILMAGFIAGNKHGELVVLGRNGSDYSAAVLAVSLHADCCEIWTDVDGMYTCDPRHVIDARPIKSISYQEAMELSYFGAKVLHPRTIAPIAQFQIPCLIKNTTNPQAPGTLISNSVRNNGNPIKGITNMNSMVMFSISGSEMKNMISVINRVFAAMSRTDVSIVPITCSLSKYNIGFCVPQNEQRRARLALESEFFLELKYGLLEPLNIVEQLAIVSVICDNIQTQRSIFSKLFTALTRANIDVVTIVQGISERWISAIVNNNEAIMAVRIAHQILFNTDQIIETFVIGINDADVLLSEKQKNYQIS